MMPLDRSKAPEFQIPDDFSLSSPSKIILNNKASLFFIPTPGQNTVKIEVLGKSNRSFLDLNETLIPSFTLQMIQEGILNKTGQEIANFFDFHASEVNSALSYLHEGFSLLTTKKHLHSVIPVFLSLFTDAIFPEEYLEKKKSQRKLSIKLEKEKTASKASQLFRSGLFGSNHPFGLEITESHVEIISREKLKFYYEELLWQDIEIFVNGDFDNQEIAHISDLLGTLPNRPCKKQMSFPELETGSNVHESRADAVQSSIRIGTWSIDKAHPDFFGVSVFNTILGGYFGSRLIKNIREDKGHTYGISSSLAQIGTYNYWVIGADVQKAFTQEVIREIYHEIDQLVNNPVEADELEVVRNYIIGQMLSGFSSSYDLMDRFQAIHHSGLDLDFYTQKLSYLKEFTAQDILDIGQKYFSKRPLLEIVVG
jgi:predicted Zn-dependent peptidase